MKQKKSAFLLMEGSFDDSSDIEDYAYLVYCVWSF